MVVNLRFLHFRLKIMYRYLLNISHIGTHFRGLQKNLDSQKYDIKASVQGSIELGLTKLNPVLESKRILSSHTDSGVHALNTAVHVDLKRFNGQPYSPSRITAFMNKYFNKENLQIRINKTEIVPDTFHSRYNAKRRTYLYRLAIAKREPPINENKASEYIPIDERDRCFFVHDPKFDIDLAQKAAALIRGSHDFRTFMGIYVQNSKQDHPFFTLRDIDSLKIEPGHSTCNTFSKSLADENYNYFNIHISGRSFLNRQVRRTVSVILGVAQERLTIRDVYEMLTIPSKNSWSVKASVVPAHGLYLCQVEYNEKDKEFPVGEDIEQRIDTSDSCTIENIDTTESQNELC